MFSVQAHQKAQVVELVFIVGPRLCGKTQVALEYAQGRGCGSWKVLGSDALPSTLSLHRRNKALWSAMSSTLSASSSSSATPSPTTATSSPLPSTLVSLILDVDNGCESTRAATIGYLRGRIAELYPNNTCTLRVTVVRVAEGPTAPISLDTVSLDAFRGVGGHYGGKVRHQLLGYALADHALRLSLDVQQAISAHKAVNGNAPATMLTIGGDQNEGSDADTLTTLLRDMSVIGHIYSATTNNKGCTNAQLQQQGVDQVESVRIADRLNDLPRRYSSEYQRCFSTLPAHRHSFFASTFNGPRVSALFIPVSSLMTLASMSKESGKEAVLRRLRSGSRHLTGQTVLEPIGGVPADNNSSSANATITTGDGVYPVLDDATVEFMWQWMLGGGDDDVSTSSPRRAIVVCGDPNDDVIDDSGYMRGAPSTSSVPATNQPLSQIQISAVGSLLETARFPFPIYSMLLATSTSPASVPLPLDCCGVAYLERMLQLDLPSSCLVLPQSGYSRKLVLSPPEFHVIGNFVSLSDPDESTKALHRLKKPATTTPSHTPLVWRTHPFFFTTEGERIVGAQHTPTGRQLPFIHPQGDKLLSAHVSLHCVDDGAILPALSTTSQQMPTTTKSLTKGPTNHHHAEAEKDDDNFIVQIQASTTVGALQVASTQHALPVSTNNTSTQEGGGDESTSSASPPSAPTVPPPKFLLTNAAVVEAFPTASCVAGDKYVVAKKIEIPSIRWSWRPPTATLNFSTLLVRGNCLNSNSASKHKCLLLVRDGKVGLSFCTCGTCATGYGGSLCRHSAALALQLSRTPSTQLLPQLSSSTVAEDSDGSKKHVVANNAEDEDDNDNDRVRIRAGVGAADLSTYILPSEPAIMQGMLPAFLFGGTKGSRARAAAGGKSGVASTTSPATATSTRTSLPSKLISHLLGPNAPSERPLTTYFYFCRSRRAVVMKEVEEGKHADEEGANKTAKVAKILASMWHSLPADEKQVINDDCAAFNTAIKAQWETYMASDEYATVMSNFNSHQQQQQQSAAMSPTPTSKKSGASPKRRSGGATIALGGKRAREGGDAPTDDDNTPDEDTLDNLPSSQRVAREFEQMHSEWRRDSNGNWVCAWDDADPLPTTTTTTTTTTTAATTLSRTSAAVGGARVPTLHQPGKQPAEAAAKAMLGSYYPGDDEGNPSTSGLMNRAYTTGRLAASSAASGSWGGAAGDETARGGSSSTVAPAHRSTAPSDPAEGA